MTRLFAVALAAFLLAEVMAPKAGAAPTTERLADGVRVTGAAYRFTVKPSDNSFAFEIKDGQGVWRNVSKRDGEVEFGYAAPGGLFSSLRAKATFKCDTGDDATVIGMQLLLDPMSGFVADLHFICAEDGVLLRFAANPSKSARQGDVWALPRFLLDDDLFDAFVYWAAPDDLHAKAIAALDPPPAYAGVSPWGRQGDTAARLSATHPALIVRSEKGGVGFGAVLVNYASDWAGASCFFQRHRPDAWYFYPGFIPAASAAKAHWAWLAPFSGGDHGANAAKVERLLREAQRRIAEFKPVAPELPASALAPVPDFPPDLRPAAPVGDLGRAIVYTMNEPTESEYDLSLARKTGADVVIRGWFKWGAAPDWRRFSPVVKQVHDLGALFGGGVTCSALYDRENGLTDAQVRDMATRGPDRGLVDAWGQKGIRHGTLSNPRYVDYVLSWCFKQIDAGADYLFMDEIEAALGENEGYDDYSLKDFREYLARTVVEGKGWAADDTRWATEFGIDLTDKAQAPDGTINSFDYCGWLAAKGFVKQPYDRRNRLAPLWQTFRVERDDRAWQAMRDGIRAYAAKSGRPVYISANGLAKGVDLQVLGVWDRWLVKEGRVNLSDSQLDAWASTVRGGWDLAGRKVPVVLFHDWGFGFPWMDVPPADRVLWMRTRGAEIYASGGFFAFPVRGPYGQDALRDGTLSEIQRLTVFYRQNQEMYLDATPVSVNLAGIDAMPFPASVALWRDDKGKRLMLHVINRSVEAGDLVTRKDVRLPLPASVPPDKISIVSPDWDGVREGRREAGADGPRVVIPELDAYAVVVLDYASLDALPALTGVLPPRIVPERRWAPAARNEFVVRADGWVEGLADLNGYLHGDYHNELRNPPTFLINAKGPATVRVNVRAVATLGAKIECLIDGKLSASVNLPDLDHRNDSAAPEYNKMIECPVPPGRHRVTIRNAGGDWASVAWYQFAGELNHETE